MAVHTFALDFALPGKQGFSVFPFMMDNHPVEGISCLISSRSCGDMASFANSNAEPGTSPNRQRLFKALNLQLDRITFLRQVHSRKVVETDSSNPCRGIEADGLICRDKNIFLSVAVADCLPVYLYDSESGGFALLHSGWKGTGIVLNALELMKKNWGTRAEAVAAVLGPCIRSCCYRVDEQRAAAFAQEFGASSCVQREDGYYLDLQAANVKLLTDAGVRNIAVCTDCTFTDERLGSFRREGPKFTHMLAMVGSFPG